MQRPRPPKARFHQAPSRQNPSRGPAPSQAAVGQMLAASGIELTPHQLGQLWRYHNLLRRRNVGNELTRLIGFETIVTKHYIDCMVVGDLFKLPSPLVDIGTGPGFPGIPLKIRYPHLKLVLAEPRPKRVAFLKECIQELGLKDTEVFEHRVVSQSFQTPVQGAITRAVETMDKTILRTSGSLVPGGKLIFMKGPNADAEVREVQARFPDFSLEMDHSYTLPHTPHQRRLIVWKKPS